MVKDLDSSMSIFVNLSFIKVPNIMKITIRQFETL